MREMREMREMRYAIKHKYFTAINAPARKLQPGLD